MTKFQKRRFLNYAFLACKNFALKGGVLHPAKFLHKKMFLEAILNNLGSDEARQMAISKLVGKVDLPPHQIERAIQNYEAAGWFNAAADLALKIGQNERAEQLRTISYLIDHLPT